VPLRRAVPGVSAPSELASLRARPGLAAAGASALKDPLRLCGRLLDLLLALLLLRLPPPPPRENRLLSLKEDRRSAAVGVVAGAGAALSEAGASGCEALVSGKSLPIGAADKLAGPASRGRLGSGSEAGREEAGSGRYMGVVAGGGTWWCCDF
jgi:hypothetical protein